MKKYAGWLNVLLPLKEWVVYNVDLRKHDLKSLRIKAMPINSIDLFCHFMLL